MGILDNKVCLITGGAGSLGLASAAAFIREGGKVMLVDLHEDRLAAAAQSIKEPIQASEVVGSVLFLVSSWSNGITGNQVLADRGLNKL